MDSAEGKHSLNTTFSCIAILSLSYIKIYFVVDYLLKLLPLEDNAVVKRVDDALASSSELKLFKDIKRQFRNRFSVPVPKICRAQVNQCKLKTSR